MTSGKDEEWATSLKYIQLFSFMAFILFVLKQKSLETTPWFVNNALLRHQRYRLHVRTIKVLNYFKLSIVASYRSSLSFAAVLIRARNHQNEQLS